MTTAVVDERRLSRFAGLEGYRGIASLGIVIYHVFQQVIANEPGSLGEPGDIGYTILHQLDGTVALFFVLSAFLLILPFVTTALEQRDPPSARAFLVRRAARVLPLYYVAILIVWSSRNINLPGAVSDLVQHLTLTQIYFNEHIFWTIGPAWSLAVEISFYILLAALGTWGVHLAKGRSRTWVIWSTTTVLVLAAAGSLAYKVLAWYVWGVAGDDWKVWFGLAAKLDEFALGGLLAVIVAVKKPTVSRRAAAGLACAGLATVAVAVATRPLDGAQHVFYHSFAALGFTLLIAASVMSPRFFLNTVLDFKPVALLGLVSYSLYMWHEPLMILLDNRGLLPETGGYGSFWVMVAVVLPIAMLISWISYQAIERPGNAIRGVIDKRGRSRDYYDGS